MKYIITTLTLFIGLQLCAQNIYDGRLTNDTIQSSEEGEAHIAMSSLDSNKMVMGFMQLNSGLSFKIYQTENGGDSWIESTFHTNDIVAVDYPAYSIIGGGDIIFAYDVNGDIYCSWIYLLADLDLPAPLDECIWTAYWAKSTDNGNSFTLEPGTNHFFGRGKINLNGGLSVLDFEDGICDRQWMAIDQSGGVHHNKLYVGYINYPFVTANSGLKVKTKASGQNSFSTENTAYTGNGQLTNIMVDGNGVLHYSFCNIISNQVFHVSSSDGGQTFSNTHLITNGVRLMPQSNRFINDRENAAPSLTIDGDNILHLVWSDFPENIFPKSYYSKSLDGGVNWTVPIELSTLFSDHVFMPVVSSRQNKVTIGANVLDNDKKSSYYFITSENNGLNFNSPVKVSSDITDFGTIGQTGFVGDYSSGVRSGCKVYSLWTDCRTGNCKQYVSSFDECLALGITEVTPVNGGFNLLKIYPIPTQDNLNLSVESNSPRKINLTVFNLKGQEVFKTERDLLEGKNDFNISLEKLITGPYIIKLSDEDNTFITRVIEKQ